MRLAKNRLSKIKEAKFSVEGMHCPSCELLIEKRLLEEQGVKAVEATAGRNEIIIEYLGKMPSAKVLNKIFEKDGYVFSQKLEKEEKKSRDFLTIFLVAVFLILGFLALGKLGYSSFVRIDSRSTWPVIFIFGVIAGFSTCSALVGGIILSLSKQWNGLYSDKDSTLVRMEPYFLFNVGRLIAFFSLGMLLGFIGRSLQGLGMFSSLLMAAVSVMMFFMALQMLGVKALGKFQLTMPKVLTRYIADEKNFKSRYMPWENDN